MKQLVRDAGDHDVTWEFNPPGASNYGGVWERKIGSLKSILECTLLQLCGRVLSRDELNTFLQEAAAVVNNTPLWEVSHHPEDPAPLTPAMLMTLRDHPNPPPPESFSREDLLRYGSSRWRRVMFLADQFWDRWKRHYIQELQHRKVWKSANRGVSVGDIVLLKGKTKRNEWNLGRLTEVRKGSDSLVRSVVVEVPSLTGKSPRVYEKICAGHRPDHPILILRMIKRLRGGVWRNSPSNISGAHKRFVFKYVFNFQSTQISITKP
jgi:hypothetical protein